MQRDSSKDTPNSQVWPPPAGGAHEASIKVPASPIVHIISSTYHLSQVALRELRQSIRLDLPGFPMENLVVELGPYGAFDVRIDGVLVCETSKSLLHHPISNIIEQLARALAKLALTAEQQEQESDSRQQRESYSDMAVWEADSLWSSSRSSLCSQDQVIATCYNPSDMSPDGTLVGEELSSVGRGGEAANQAPTDK